MSQVRYQELGPLDAGGNSRARLGLKVAPDGCLCPVVLVLAPPEVMANTEALAHLRRETARASALQHPHILQVHGLAPLKDGVARVTEFADGESLRRVLERAGRLPPLLAARLVADAALGVSYAHLDGNEDGMPLVHGDLRPETLLLSFSGMVKVTGYGALTVAPREPNGLRVPNRRAYCAPEQILGGRAAVQPATDVFLLGLLLFECLSGRRPFASAEDFDQAVLSSPLPLLPGDVPEPLGQVVARCTAKRAKERYSSALCIRDALDAAAGGDLPSHAELAKWLVSLFPGNDPARIYRQRALKVAMTGAAGESKEERPPQLTPFAATQPHLEPTSFRELRAAEPLPTVEVPRASETPAAIARSTTRSAVTEPSPAVSSAELPSSTHDRKKRRGRGFFVGAFGCVLAAAAVAALRPAALPEPAVPVAEPATPLKTISSEPPAPSPSQNALAEVAPRLDRGQTTAAQGTLEVEAEPTLEVSARGVALGRTPLRVPLLAGRHVLTLRNGSEGIATTRVVVVPAGGVVRRQVNVERGFVSVSAPEGTTVSIDGRVIGTAPLSNVGLYEGNHRIVVTVGEARWQQGFTLKASEHMRFNVDLQPEP